MSNFRAFGLNFFRVMEFSQATHDVSSWMCIRLVAAAFDCVSCMCYTVRLDRGHYSTVRGVCAEAIGAKRR